MVKQSKTTLFIGAGNMAQSILTGYKASGGDMAHVSVLDPFADVELAVGLNLKGLYRRIDEIEPDTLFDVVVLAVKPQIFETFGTDWASVLIDGGTVISIMAGVSSTRITACAGKPCSVVRCMPNMAAAVGRSVNVAYTADSTRKKTFETLFSGSGAIRWLANEDDMHLTTAISGSGPAYFFAFVEALAQAGTKAGLPAQLSLDLSIDTMIGAADLLKTKRAPADLRQSVTSKGGTTAAALDAFGLHDNLKAIVEDAVAAAVARSRELSL
ncbi:pyrroline-5-carboxylate reductase [Leisingera sp. NJS201]|uniref:pyrroline-5-carboxylate reductase n=1 Tax=unclassified Leisingera TaxID=2614906 RepID=UPI001070AFB5|nr:MULTISPECIES: pyrroline-5-carboxylate reductase [unclassified Leisingera]QBR37857.1 pyrroline-5-carboxylate reductase [Leisingera sp. NJS201]